MEIQPAGVKMIPETDMTGPRERFRLACDKVLSSQGKRGGIGTLSEKTLHAVLKYYYEPRESNHEIRFGRYVTDIAGENGVIEIQTRQFNKLRNKLEFLLPQTQVTVVYPVAASKWIIWIDEQTGEMTKKRKSPKRGKPWEVFFELYKIKNFLTHTNFRLCIVLLDMEEYRSLNGWSEDKKKGSSRYDRIPVSLLEEITVHSPAEYEKLIPEGLEGAFTSKEFKKASGLSLAASQTALNVLYSTGAVTRIGKQGNRYVYEKTALCPFKDVPAK